MKGKKVFWILLAVIIVAALVLFLTGGNNKKTNTNSVTNTAVSNTNTTANRNSNSATANRNTTANSNTATANSNSVTTNANTAAKTVSVSVTSSGFSLSTVTVNAGDTVTWTNASGGTVYVAPDDHPSHRKYAGTWDDDGTGSISNGQSYSKTFTVAGTYTYHNHLKTSQTGTIVVQ